MYGKEYKNHLATSTWLSEYYVERIRDNPSSDLVAMQKAMLRDLMLEVDIMKVYRAKKKGLHIIEGSHKEQYHKLRDYSKMILLKNPGSIAYVQVERPLPNCPPMFLRLFICFTAMKKGSQYCRPFIGLNGCHLTGPFGGIVVVLWEEM